MSAPLRIVRRTTVKSVLDNKGSDNEGLKTYLDRLLKLIPAEVLSLYLVGSGVIPKKNTDAVVVWAGFCLIAVIIVKAYGTSDKAKDTEPDWIHVTISTVAFVVWLYSMGGPFVGWGLHKPYIGSLLILGFTFLVPYVYRGQADVNKQ